MFTSFWFNVTKEQQKLPWSAKLDVRQRVVSPGDLEVFVPDQGTRRAGFGPGLAWRSTKMIAGLQRRMRVEFRFRTHLNCRTYTVPWTFELTTLKYRKEKIAAFLGEKQNKLLKLSKIQQKSGEFCNILYKISKMLNNFSRKIWD